MIKIVKKSLGCLFSFMLINLLSLMLVTVIAIWLGLSYLPVLIEKVVERNTGFGLEIGELNINPFTGVADLQQTILTNPEDFPDPDFIHVNIAKIDVDVFSLIEERKVIEELVLDIGEVGLFTNEAGDSNATIFFQTLKQSEESGPSPDPSGEPVQFIIKRLVIRLHSVKISYYSRGKLHTSKIEPNLDLELSDITDLNQVIKPLRQELRRKGIPILAQTLLHSITGLQGNSKDAGEWLQNSVESLGEGAVETGKAVKNILEKLKK